MAGWRFIGTPGGEVIDASRLGDESKILFSHRVARLCSAEWRGNFFNLIAGWRNIGPPGGEVIYASR